MEKLLLVIAGVCVIIAIHLAIQDEEEWDKFSDEHDCKIVAVVQPTFTSLSTIDVNGNLRSVQPSFRQRQGINVMMV